MDEVPTQTDDSYLTRAKAILVQKAAADVKSANEKSEDLWAALVMRSDITRALEDLLEIPGSSPERFYGAVRRLLNTISHEYNIVVHGPCVQDSTPAVIFANLHDYTVPRVVKTDPDWQAVMGTHRDLKEALECLPEPIDCPRAQAVLCGVGGSEYKADEMDIMEQFVQHLASIKSVRPDLTTVHGFQLDGGQIYLASLNACGLAAFEGFDRCNPEAWVALVVLLYHSSDTRDRRLTYVPAGRQDSGRWDIRRDPDSQVADFSVSSNDATNAPGRMTWTAFVPAVIHDDFVRSTREVPAIGVLKVSWQRPGVTGFPSASTGSPCPETGTGDPVAPAANQAAACSPTAAKPDDIALLPGEDVGASTASEVPPLPKLPETEGELLRYAHKDGWLPGLVRYHDFPPTDEKIAFNVGEDKHVRFKEIIHLASIGEPLSQCDSTLDILEVVYDLTETHLQMLERKILHRDLSWFNILCKPWHDPATYAKKEVPGIPCINKIFGDENGKPVMLLIDLDHATHTDRIWNPAYKTDMELTGTPMFVAMELSAMHAERLVRYPRGDRRLMKLKADLQAAEKDTEVFARAFPGERSTTFMRNFEAVMELEEERFDSEESIRLDPLDLHRAHHDVQSIYWTLLWTFARALPRDSDASVTDTGLDAFCRVMLSHKVGDESVRPLYIGREARFSSILHPAFKHFKGLFRSLTEYFMIPWHIYLKQGRVEPDHAHHAIRRLLLAEIIHLRGEGKEFNILLNTMQPRIFELDEWNQLCFRKALVRDEPRPVSASFSTVATGSKRKLSPDDSDGDGAEIPERQAKKPKVEAANEDPRSAAAMHNKFRESRLLWFGTGRRV